MPLEDTMELDRPESFSRFSDLPPEIRLVVWEYSLPGTRIVSVRCGADDLMSDSRRSPVAVLGCTTTTPNPANLHICVESRTEAIKSYRRCFGFAHHPGHIYFDPSRDVLYFGPRAGYMAADAQFRTCMSMCDEAELAAVRRIALSDALFWQTNTYHSMTATGSSIELLRIIRRRLPNLELIVFVPREQDEANPDELDHTLQRIHEQVLTAFNTLAEDQVTWSMPEWHVTTLKALYSAAGGSIPATQNMT